MRNEEIKALLKEAVAGSNKKCQEHGERIAVIETNQSEFKEDLNELKIDIKTLLVRQAGIKDELLVFKTKKNMIVGIACAVWGVGGVILGAIIDLIVKKFGGLSWLM